MISHAFPSAQDEHASLNPCVQTGRCDWRPVISTVNPRPVLTRAVGKRIEIIGSLFNEVTRLESQDDVSDTSSIERHANSEPGNPGRLTQACICGVKQMTRPRRAHFTLYRLVRKEIRSESYAIPKILRALA